MVCLTEPACLDCARPPACLPAYPPPPGVRATLSGGGIMSLLFGRNRAMLAAGEALNGLPRLPLSLKPLQGDLAAAINNGSRGFDVGQANPIWVSKGGWLDRLAGEGMLC